MQNINFDFALILFFLSKMSNLYSNTIQFKNNQEQISGEPDPSNPYSYPSNPQPIEEISLANSRAPSNFNSNSSNGDPELTKIRSSFWKRAGQLQSAIGSVAGVESWKDNGMFTEEEAEREYRNADERMKLGDASRFHGEYERIMGLASYAIGHIAGDSEMQIKANERTENGLNEINRSYR
jgi:hypothetical protein